MSENTTPLFAELTTGGAALVRKPNLTADDIAQLKAGDFAVFGDSWAAPGILKTLAAKGVNAQTAKHWHETETVQHRGRRQCVTPEYTDLIRTRGSARLGDFYDSAWIDASTAAFAATWDSLAVEPNPNPIYESASDHVPADWLPLLPYPTLNPAQVEAMPHIRSDRNLQVVAPTGAGKTVIGMSAALQEIKQRGGKAAWLVPQRTLTAELDRDLETWRQAGLKVERLSGETATDQAAVAAADLLVATTEKFESLCRATSMAETIAAVGTIIVDEIHLLGEPGRGAVLEALLTRIRMANTGTRLVGLSATAANANQLAEWLQATLVRIAWRPTRLNQQVLTIPNEEKSVEMAQRNAVAVALAKEVTDHGGSVLVFCGAKFNIRSTALAIAASRGQEIHGIDPNDVDAVAEACHAVGIGLHYSDWPHRHRAEKEFREKTFDVLVASSTVAAGVNTPARAVVIRDTSIGPTMMEISMIQQMCGRAGRAGKESEGFAYIVTRSDETKVWRQRLAAGYYIRSRIADTLPDHILGEMVQGKITTRREAHEWWVQTFGFFQRAATETDLAEALERLDKFDFIECESPEADAAIRPTALGSLTSRMMINVSDAISLRVGLSSKPSAPNSAREAEDVLIETVATSVYGFSNVAAPAAVEQRAALLKVVQAKGDVTALSKQKVMKNRAGSVSCDGTQVVMAGLYLVARSPQVIAAKNRLVAGIPRGTLQYGIQEAPRYFAWMAAQGQMGTIPAWAAMVGRDLGLRTKWFDLAPERGDGATLASLEKTIPAAQRSRRVPEEFITGMPVPGARPRFQVKKEGHVAQVEVTGAASFSAFALHQPLKGKPEWRRVPLTKGAGRARVDGGGAVAAFDGKGRMIGSGWLAPFSG